MLDPERLSFEFVFDEEVPPKVRTPRLDEFIARQLPKLSLTLIRRLIAEGDVLVNGTASLKGERLNRLDKVTVKLFAAEKSAATPEPIPLNILFEDADLIVINKPVGLLVHHSNSEKSGTLLNGLAYYFWEKQGEPVRPGLVHRLDRNTSGVIVIAKTPRAHRTLSKHFRERWVRKFYLALVSGVVAQDTGELDAPIGSDPNKWPHWGILPVEQGGRAAQTRYRVKQRFARHTLLELEPLTGRTHQLRIHCQLLGHPIVGDPHYTDAIDPLAKQHRLKQHLLHAARLVFKHPATGKELNIQAPLPAQMQELIAQL
jgi:23S rRNA pseudouridine1911/1915/1917 synthase